MTEDDLVHLLRGKIDAASGSYGGQNQWQADRLRADRYYKGEARGDEKEGRSQVVSRDVAEAVDALMPSLMRVFASSDKVVEFQPTGPEDEEQAEQATDYVNWIWLQQNAGFRIMHDWFKDGLLHRLGVLKVWWDSAPLVTRENYRGLTADEVDILKTDPEIELIEVNASGVADIPSVADPLTDKAQTVKTPLFDLVVRRKKQKGRVRIMPVPPEEFLVDTRTRSLELDHFTFAAHQTQRAISDLVAEGYDMDTLGEIGSNDELDDHPERTERFRDESGHGRNWDHGLDPSLRNILVSECYMKVDVDGDGIAELRKITLAGNVILDNVEIDDHPFIALTPKLTPHKLIGRSIADDLYDLQDIKTTIWRQMLDNIYLANNNRTIVVNDQVNLDDLLTVRPGGVVRVKQPGAIQPFPFQNVIGDAYRIIEYSDSVKENRIGLTRYNQGLDANTLNKTATGITQIMDAARQREELIARIYAESVALAFKKILRLVSQYQDYEQIVRLRGKFVPMDPRSWRDNYDVTVAVGLGTGNKDQAVFRMMQLIDLDLKLFGLQGNTGNVLVTPKNLYNKLAKIIEASGLKATDPYYTDPSAAAAQNDKGKSEPKPLPEEMQFQAELQMAQAKFEVELQGQRAKNQAEIEAKLQMARAEIAIEKMKAEAALAMASGLALQTPIGRATMTTPIEANQGAGIVANNGMTGAAIHGDGEHTAQPNTKGGY